MRRACALHLAAWPAIHAVALAIHRNARAAVAAATQTAYCIVYPITPF